MSIWHQVTLKNVNQTRYMKSDVTVINGQEKRSRRFISKDNVPPVIMSKFNQGENDVDDVDLNLNAPSTDCLFCGTPDCKLSRMMNSQTIYLCDEHYYSENMGHIAQKLREVNDESEVKQEA